MPEGSTKKQKLQYEHTRSVVLGVATGAAMGALAMYALDPVKGRSRRARYADQAMGMVRRETRRGLRLGRAARSLVAGKVEAVRQGTGGQADLNDASLAQKVETKLFRDPAVPKGSINVNVEDGSVVLRGEVETEDQRRDIEQAASTQPGVIGVRNLISIRS